MKQHIQARVPTASKLQSGQKTYSWLTHAITVTNTREPHHNNQVVDRGIEKQKHYARYLVAVCYVSAPHAPASYVQVNLLAYKTTVAKNANNIPVSQSAKKRIRQQ